MRLKRLLPLLVAVPLVLALAFVARAQAAKPKATAGAATAEVKVGTGIEKMELQGEDPRLDQSHRRRRHHHRGGVHQGREDLAPGAQGAALALPHPRLPHLPQGG